MKHLTAIALPVAIVAVAFIFAAGFCMEAATITWTNTSGGNWSVANNWSPNHMPTNTDDGLITNAGIYTVTLDVSGVVANLTLGEGDGAGGVQMLLVTNLSQTVEFNVGSLLQVTNPSPAPKCFTG